MAVQQTLPVKEPYPARTPFFFHRFTRLLLKYAVAQRIKADGCWLLTQIAALEDCSKYTKPIDWTDAQLCPFLGISPSKLVRIRRKCVEEGWLHFEPGSRGYPSRYWVLVPARFSEAGTIFDESGTQFDVNLTAQVKRNCSASEAQVNRNCSASGALLPNTLQPNPTPAPIGGGGVELNSQDGRRPTADTAEQSARGDDLTEQACTWDQTTVEALIRECLAVGVRDRRRGARAVRSASTLGWTPDTVRQAIEFVQKHAATFKSPGGVLIWRLEQPAADIRRGWPEEPEAANDAKRKAAVALQQSAAARQAHDEHAAHVAAESARYEQLEFEFGAVLDAKPVDELVALAHQASLAALVIATLKRKGRAEGIVRRKLLVVLAEAAS
jgi:hypothetical protein